ncbi:site-2 protease family protein [Cohnella abietis]|uniref:Putative zinc metalloprotease YwhC n=1 Tax=Cohnella abietis TaxID=2507935 RepID=A0A3T1D9I6_9BACL|nr:site-2 protease family protein [Cohnella abietis]BBI34750.1 putative zinc metalloprotease YwhC [Cohnella abietis]
MSFFWFPIEDIPVILLVMLVAFSVHEFAHAWTAWKFGDDTAYKEGRVTLNPMAHLDLIGMLFLLLAGFGWAKPVPVRRSRFKNPRLMNILVSAAGPISNLILAFLILFVMDLLHSFNVIDNISSQMLIFISYWVKINLSLLLFNLIPMPPLDGYRILEEFLPIRIRIKIQEMAQWTTFIFLLIIFIPPLRAITIGPLMDLRGPIMEGMGWLLDSIFSSAGGSMFYRV